MGLFPWFKKLASARTIASRDVLTYDRKAFIPAEAFDWDDDKNRRLRYGVYEGYYTNTVYTSAQSYSQTLKSDGGLYKFVRAIFNPVPRLVESYVAEVYGGTLDIENPEDGAIQIETENEALLPAIGQIWQWSNWDTGKSLYVRYGANLGDSFIKIVDDVKKSKVRLEVLHPGKVSYVKVDEIGNVQSIIIQYYVTDDDTGLDWLYTETIDKEKFAAYRDGEPYAVFSTPSGETVSEFDNPYGFVPVVKVMHRDVGYIWGANPYTSQLPIIDEINDQQSVLNDNQRRANNPPLIGTGIRSDMKLKLVETVDSNDNAVRDAAPFIGISDKDASLDYLMMQLDVQGNAANIAGMLEELSRNLPELSMQSMRASGTMTATEIRVKARAAIARYQEAMGNYNLGLVRAQQMAVAIAGFRQLQDFAGFGLDSYNRGDLDHSIKLRTVIDDSLSAEQRVTLLAQVNSMHPALQRLALEELGVSQEEIDQIVGDQLGTATEGEAIESVTEAPMPVTPALAARIEELGAVNA